MGQRDSVTQRLMGWERYWRVLIDLRPNVPMGVREKGATVAMPTPQPLPGVTFLRRRLTPRGCL